MYKIVNGDTVLTTVNTPVWVKKQENGCFTLCDESSAHGVVVDGTVYHITGRPEIDGAETIVLSEISEATYQRQQAAALSETQLQMETSLGELSILIANTIAAAN